MLRRFVHGFAKVAEPLHALTQKGATFDWKSDCQIAFDRLKCLLTEAPILAYTDFQKDSVLETDASVKGLGAVLSQLQDDKRLHPIAYASCFLSPQENKYEITELETLAVVRDHTALSCLPLWTRHSVHQPLSCESSARDAKSQR